MAIKNIKKTNPRIPVPITASPKYKVTIVRDDGTVDDITTNIISGECYLSGTNEIGSFRFDLNNTDGQYSELYDGGEYLNIYLDYVDATTLYFKGRLDEYDYGINLSTGFTMSLIGRDYPIYADMTTTLSFYGANIYTSFVGTTGSIDSEGNYENGILYNSGLTWHSSNPITSTTTITSEYSDQSLINIGSDVLTRLGYDSYIYYDTSASKWYIKVFVTDSETNNNEFIGYGINMINSNIVKNFNDEFNRIRIYGKEDSNIIYLRTGNNSSSQTNLWTKDKKINDNLITDMSSLVEKTTSEIAKNVALQKGNISVLPLPTLKPNETIKIIIPYCQMNGQYTIKNIRTSFGTDGSIVSSVDVQKKNFTLATIFKERIDENMGLQPSTNLNNMNNSYTIDFDKETNGIHSNTEIASGKLKMTDTASPGTWISDIYTFSDTISEVELRFKANYDIDGSTFYVSANNGGDYVQLNYGVLTDIISPGTQIKIKIVFASTVAYPNPAIEKICLLCK